MIFLESCVRFAEINQWPLDVITRMHVHVRDLLLRGRDKDRDSQTQTDNQRQIDRQTERDRESQTGRHTDIKTQRETTRKTDRQTNKSIAICLTLSCSFRKCIASVFSEFQLSKGTIFEMSHRVCIVLSQYRLAFLDMLA